MPNLYVGDPFFKTWKQTDYKFLGPEVQARFYNATNKSSGQIILWTAKDRIEKATGIKIKKEELISRSKYNPDMLRPACQKWEEGGKMGDYNPESLSKAYGLVRKQFLLPAKVNPIEIEDVPFHNNTNSGLPWLSKKVDVYDEALKEVKAIRRGKAPNPFVIFWRGKNLEEARVVNGEGFAEMLLNGRFYHPYMESLLHTSSPFAGGRKNSEVAVLANEIRSMSRFVGQFDYSGFDTSIPQKLVSMAFSIIAENINFNTDRDLKDWNICLKHFMYSPFVAPDGKMYSGRRHGVPSGSLWTQLIDSIVNALVIAYTAIELGWKVTKVSVLGDDSVVGFLHPVTDLDLVASKMFELGIRLNAKKSKVTPASQDIHFLGHYWTWGVPTRDVKETLVRILTPERWKPWMNASDSDIFMDGLIDRVRAFQNDSRAAWFVLQQVIDSYRIGWSRPNFLGMIKYREDFINVTLLPSGLQRARLRDLPPKGSPRIVAMI